jgi:hypothetical protein
MCRLREMERFVGVVKTGSFSAAARDFKSWAAGNFQNDRRIRSHAEYASFGSIDPSAVPNRSRDGFLRRMRSAQRLAESSFRRTHQARRPR